MMNIFPTPIEPAYRVQWKDGTDEFASQLDILDQPTTHRGSHFLSLAFTIILGSFSFECFPEWFFFRDYRGRGKFGMVPANPKVICLAKNFVELLWD